MSKVRNAPIELEPETFRKLGHRLVDRIAEHLATLRDGKVTAGDEPASVRAALGHEPLPEAGTEPGRLLDEAAELLFDHSLYNGHPRFFGFITSSAAPIGALGDLLASAINPNVGGWPLAPMATEIELQTVRWLAELVGYPNDCGGLLVSGGNVANFVGFWVGRRVQASWNLRERGVAAGGEEAGKARFYVSAETHTWIQKACDLGGYGTDAIRWIETDDRLRMRTDALAKAIGADREVGLRPTLVVAAAGTVSTGAVDPIREIAALCREQGLWLHVDGAYGAPAACLPDAPPDLRSLALADSLAFDPHKWLYAPLEAGCALVRDRKALRDTFVFHPPYYPDADSADDAPAFLHELGPQNSRGFRALKVWLGLRQVGRSGYRRMIHDDVELARRLLRNAEAHPELEAGGSELSITTFRCLPPDLAGRRDEAAVAAYLDALNERVMESMWNEGDAFVSQAMVAGRFWLRACIVNFRTSEQDVDRLPEIAARLARAIDRELRPEALRHEE